jgi:hypothetical protein
VLVILLLENLVMFDVYMLYLLSKQYSPVQPYSASKSTQHDLVYEPTARAHSVMLQMIHAAQHATRKTSSIFQTNIHIVNVRITATYSVL